MRWFAAAPDEHAVLIGPGDLRVASLGGVEVDRAAREKLKECRRHRRAWTPAGFRVLLAAARAAGLLRRRR